MSRHVHGMGCGCGMNGLGQAPGGTPAGEVAGVAMVSHTVRQMADNARTYMGSEAFDPANFEALRRRAAAGERIERLSRAEIRDFVLGTIAQMADGVARAKQLARLSVSSQLARDDNWAAQNALLGPAALMGDKAREILRDMRPIRAPGTSGLGFFPAVPVAAWVAIAVIGAVMGASAIAGFVYWGDASRRFESAAREAERICAAASGGCSSAERTRIIRELSGGGMFETAAQQIAAGVGTGLGDALKVLLVGGTVAGGAYVWWSMRSARKPRESRRAAREYFQ